MRFIIYGAGAIGGVLGAGLFAAGHEVVLIARGAHLAAIRRDGLRLESPGGVSLLPIPAVSGPGEIDFTTDDVVVLAMKGNDTAAAVEELRRAAGSQTPICCVQNGVNNERVALRLFANVYGVCVIVPGSHLEPGIVQLHSAPTAGLLDLGRYPTGVDETATKVSAAFQDAGFLSEPRPDIMAWKYRKLLSNLGNAAQAACGTGADTTAVLERLRAEGMACLEAANIPVVSAAEYGRRHDELARTRSDGGPDRHGGSSWQSLHRSTGSIESDYLNGEIVLLGRLHDIPTPANELLRTTAIGLAHDHRPPGTVSPQELLGRLAS